MTKDEAITALREVFAKLDEPKVRNNNQHTTIEKDFDL